MINVGVSGPGVIRAVVESLPGESLSTIAEAINEQHLRLLESVSLWAGKYPAGWTSLGIVDLSLPTPAEVTA